MGENLVIVESPAKAKTIEKFLGKDYTVKSSFGHIRDLAKKGLGVDTECGFKPQYEIPAEKKKVVSELKSLAEKASTIWIASDEDREGEAIAWHLFDALGLSEQNTRRIAFHEITKGAILEAIEHPRSIDMDLVNAQQARRVLDRIVGFELSPILWRRIKSGLSAGRVQSVALRLVVEREREINAFKPQPYFRIEAAFTPEGTKTKVKASLEKRFNTAEEALAFLEKCKDCNFTVTAVDRKEVSRTPAAPFTTSSLQQEASRKLGFSVKKTMSVAQRLYEAGKITYMRTDSVNLSNLALGAAKSAICEMFGEEYSKSRQYRTKSKGAQEAHEAIRPTFIQDCTITGTNDDKRLYNLIWKRTVASQMADARLERTTVTIGGDKIDEKFALTADSILFDGFLKLYIEGHDDGEENEDDIKALPRMEVGQGMKRREIKAIEKYTSRPLRYTEASLVKKLEELGIGRPSTYAPTISTIMDRGYVIKGEHAGEELQTREFTLKENEITEVATREMYGNEKGKLLPENIGMAVTDYLSETFPDILDYGFTAAMEEDFDKVAAGKKVWSDLIGEFYAPFHEKVKERLTDSSHVNSERVLGTDPKTGKQVIARIGRHGPIVQMGTGDDPEKRFASITKGQLIETITLEEALSMLQLPRTLGSHDGHEVVASTGKFGPYIKFGSKYFSLPKNLSPYTVTLEEAARLIVESLAKEADNHIAEFSESGIQVLNGRYGPYIKKGKSNYRIPKGTDPKKLDEEACLAIIEKAESSTKKKK